MNLDKFNFKQQLRVDASSAVIGCAAGHHWHFHLHIDQYPLVAHLYESIELTHEAPVTVVLARM